MKIDWTDTAIKIAIATLVGTWAVFLRRWLENPSARISDKTTAKNTLQKIGAGLKWLLLTVWFCPSISIILGMVDLRKLVHLSAVVTPQLVLSIAWACSEITFGVVMFFVLGLLDVLRDHDAMRTRMIGVLKDMVAIQKTAIETDHAQSEAVKGLIEYVFQDKNEPPKSLG